MSTNLALLYLIIWVREMSRAGFFIVLVLNELKEIIEVEKTQYLEYADQKSHSHFRYYFLKKQVR